MVADPPHVDKRNRLQDNDRIDSSLDLGLAALLQLLTESHPTALPVPAVGADQVYE